MSAAPRPVLFVTNLVAPDRMASFAALHARTPIELALFGGRSHHATPGVDDPGVPHRHVAPRDVHALAASGRYRAVVCGTAGRVALPAAVLGARRAGVPFVLWTALWAQPRSPAHLAGGLLLSHLYRHADAVVTYGPHVTAHARARGARRLFTAPQAVDPARWPLPASPRPEQPLRALFVGRDAPGKGLDVLLDAWPQVGGGARLDLVGVPPGARPLPPAATAHGPVDPGRVRNFLHGASVLVMPSVPTATFREPWGLVANEAMHTGLPVIATDAVGACAGGLVRHERNGLVVPAGDAGALAGALRRLRDDVGLRTALGAAARRDAAAFTPAAWAAGMDAALANPGRE